MIEPWIYQCPTCGSRDELAEEAVEDPWCCGGPMVLTNDPAIGWH